MRTTHPSSQEKKKKRKKDGAYLFLIKNKCHSFWVNKNALPFIQVYSPADHRGLFTAVTSSKGNKFLNFWTNIKTDHSYKTSYSYVTNCSHFSSNQCSSHSWWKTSAFFRNLKVVFGRSPWNGSEPPVKCTLISNSLNAVSLLPVR